jgi:hypothetical protein
MSCGIVDLKRQAFRNGVIRQNFSRVEILGEKTSMLGAFNFKKVPWKHGGAKQTYKQV